MTKIKIIASVLSIAVGLSAAAGVLLRTKPLKKEADIVLSSSNTVALRGPVTDDSVAKLAGELRALDNDKDLDKPIYLVLYTPGGSIRAGMELFEVVRGLRRPVHTVTIFAASMGFQTVQALDNRYILAGGTLMSHKASGGVRGEFGPNNDSQLDKRINFWKRRLLQMDQLTVDRTKGKQSLKSYQDAYENELWLTGAEAVEQGYADKVVTLRCDHTLKGSSTQTVTGMLGMKMNIKFSSCPLQTAPEDVDMVIPTNKGMMSYGAFIGKGGILGVDCTVAQSRIKPDQNGEILCAINSELSKERIEQERRKIFELFTSDGMKANIGYRW